MSSSLTFVLVLSVLVVAHEFGHFIVARWVGVRVEKFSIGFGPVLWGRRFGETEFCLSLLPLGGFVKLAGEDPSQSQGMKWEFSSKPLGQKFLVVLAGPLMNALLAFVIFSSVFFVGQPVLTTKIGRVLEQGAAKKAGILEGDRVTAVNGRPVSRWEDLLMEVHKNQGPLLFTIERGGAVREIALVPDMQERPDLLGKKRRVAVVGVAPSPEVIYLKSGFFKAIALGAERVWVLTVMIFASLGLMVTGALPFKESVTGPIGIFFMTQQAAQMGVVYLFYFMGSLSVSLFVLNLLPIPVLDGGHILFIVIERLKGSPLKESIKDKMTQGGLVLLLALMAFVIFQDIHRFAIIDNLRKMIGR